MVPGRIQGWSGGPDPPFCPRCKLFNIGPTVGPPPGPPPSHFLACKPKMDPPFKNPGSIPIVICKPKDAAAVRFPTLPTDGDKAGQL